MNKLAEQIANILGSAWVIGGFGLWVVTHGIVSRDYVTTISDLAIEIGFLILRAEKTQGDRMERSVRQSEKDTKLDLKKSDDIIKILKEGK